VKMLRAGEHSIEQLVQGVITKREHEHMTEEDVLSICESAEFLLKRLAQWKVIVWKKADKYEQALISLEFWCVDLIRVDAESMDGVIIECADELRTV